MRSLCVQRVVYLLAKSCSNTQREIVNESLRISVIFSDWCATCCCYLNNSDRTVWLDCQRVCVKYYPSHITSHYLIYPQHYLIFQSSWGAHGGSSGTLHHWGGPQRDQGNYILYAAELYSTHGLSDWFHTAVVVSAYHNIKLAWRNILSK